MQRKRGISLIVLVITIIVMMILAGAIILTLNNNGIINKASETVEDTNIKQAHQIAQLGWSDAYIKGARTVEELTAGVEKAFNENNLNIEDYEVMVTEAGVTVQKKVELADVWEQDGKVIYGKKSDGTVVATLNVGDVIAYDCYTGVDESKLTYTATAQVKGTSAEFHDAYYTYQAYTSEEDTIYTVSKDDVSRTWLVMGIKDGKLLLTTKEIEPKLIIQGVYGGINTYVLNDICSIYGYGTGAESARSMKAEDITLLTGLKPTYPYFNNDEDQGGFSYEVDGKGIEAIINGSYFLADDYSWYHAGPETYATDILTFSMTSASKGEAIWRTLLWDYSPPEAMYTTNSVKPVVVLKQNIGLIQADNGNWLIRE